MADFDFECVHRHMKAVGWKWSRKSKDQHIPSIVELYQKAENLLIHAAENQCRISSGGFSACSNGKDVELSFIIEEVCYNSDDLTEEEEEDEY